MNVATHAQSLYGQARSLKSPRDLEYELFARVTGRLRRALAATGPAAIPDRAAALDENRRLWTALALDLAHPANAFPAELRARLVWLADYALQTGATALDRSAKGQAATESLIEINTLVMRGLRPKGSA